MWREPPSHQRRVALAGIHVCVSIDVFAVSVNDRFSLVVLVFLKRIIRSKSASVDGQRLLLVVTEEESHGRFVSGFRWHDVSPTTPTINECEHQWLVLGITSATTFREAARARRPVALAALQPRSHVDFVDLNRGSEIDGWRVEHSSELLDAPPKRPVGNGEFSVQLVDTRVEPKERVKREQEFVEADLRVGEDRAGLVVERAVTILTEIPLILSIAAVLDHRFRPAARAVEAIAPANLFQQVRGARL